MSIDPGSYTPIYRQLADLLRVRIEAGEFAPGESLPSETRIAQEYEVGRDTVRDALAALRNEGAIITVKGAGSQVRPQHDVAVVRVDGRARVAARMPSSAEKRQLKLTDGTPVLVVHREGRDEEVHPADRTQLDVGD
ncbi:GntR family transcriptional regulator [Nonomuraea sp. NPDC050404]|uniref:GntR family transcriptional regulator n=1 Tax=Nonomuraea sp. NPDC050404 TaxID=3155783 RepID=UPI0033F1ED4E